MRIYDRTAFDRAMHNTHPALRTQDNRTLLENHCGLSREESDRFIERGRLNQRDSIVEVCEHYGVEHAVNLPTWTG